MHLNLLHHTGAKKKKELIIHRYFNLPNVERIRIETIGLLVD